MKKIWEYIKHNWITILLLTLLIGLTIAIKIFIHQFETSYYEGEFHRPEINTRHMDRRMVLTDLPDSPQSAKLKTADAPSVDSIQPWMTFDYVNVVYKLPTNYLKQILGISNSKYPNVRIDTYGKQSGIDQTLLLTTIKKYVTTYQSQ
jgi:hypothetical protein